ncbi:MAG: hypothetical protein DMD86_11250 [Candidatus Rokuibacteriota bacterium]|nr:MAG: hypothetical protein DMD86_11250 [Candidatus Rokubacteria bacterium]
MYCRPRSPLLPLLVVALAGACGWRTGFQFPAPGPDTSARPVGLITTGSAFERAGVRRRVAETLERASQRRVVLLDTPASVRDAAVKDLAARLIRANPSIVGYDWRELRCASGAGVLTVITRRVDAVYRVSLDYVERSRPATATETAELGPLAQGLRVVGLASPGTVREATTWGSVDALLFTGRRGSRPIAVARTATQVEPSALTPRPDVAALASETLQDIPPFRAPEWDTVARRLAASGCPFMALALADAGLTSTAAGRVVRTAALATIREAVKRPPRRADDDAADGPTRGEAPEAPETSPPDAAAKAGSSGTPALAPDQRYSCSALCGMHMIELCNRDKSLWDSHGRRWEPTTCGTMREEAFLKECYRQQWLGGAFHDACVVPCESEPEGRDQLLNLLQGAGCLRPG